VNQTEPEDRIATLCETMAGLVGGPITGPDGCVRVPADRDHGFQAIVITHSRTS